MALEVFDIAASALAINEGDVSVIQAVAQVMSGSPSVPIKVHDVIVQIAFRADHSPEGLRYSNAATENLEESDMIYADLIFPECISYGSSGVPTYQTEKVEVESGDEQRNTRREYPRHEYNVQMTNLPANEIAEVMNLWHVCSGDFSGFLFMDPMDHTSNDVQGAYISGSDVGPTDQLVASAMGFQMTYPLYKYYKKGAREKRRRITYIKEGTLRVAVNGFEVPTESFTYSNSTNLLQFTLPYSLSGVSITKTGNVMTGSNFSGLSEGQLIYLDGWTDPAYNFALGGDPLRVTRATSTELEVEKFDGSPYGPDNQTPRVLAINSALPPTGSEITSGYYFYVPVRFENGAAAESEIVNGMRESAIATFDNITLREIFE